MFHIFGFILIIIIAVFVIGLSLISSVLRSIFGLGRRMSSGSNQQNGRSYQYKGGYSAQGNQQDSSSQTYQDNTYHEGNSSKTEKKKKLFSKDDGEYVDYEEIKD